MDLQHATCRICLSRWGSAVAGACSEPIAMEVTSKVFSLKASPFWTATVDYAWCARSSSSVVVVPRSRFAGAAWPVPSPATPEAALLFSTPRRPRADQMLPTIAARCSLARVVMIFVANNAAFSGGAIASFVRGLRHTFLVSRWFAMCSLGRGAGAKLIRRPRSSTHYWTIGKSSADQRS